MTPWEILLARLRNARAWPLQPEVEVRRWLRVWAALRENDEPTIRALMKWPADRPLILDNLGEKIASAYGDLLFGADPTWTASDTEDQDRLDTMTGGWAAELPSAAETMVSEGEVWWRLTTQPGLSNAALSWHSRADVVPQLHGRQVMAGAFVSRLSPNATDNRIIHRHVELHGAGVVFNLLFVGRPEALGQMVDLAGHPETAMLPERWDTGVPDLLCGRMVARWGRRPLVGESIYKGVWQRLLALTEATTIGRENMRLTAKKRMMVPAAAMRANVPMKDDPSVAAALASGSAGVAVNDPNRPMPRRQWDAGEDVIAMDPLDIDEGGGGAANQPRVLEYSFEAEQLIAWIKSEVESICQRCDLVPQFIGSGDFGSAASGTALRVRLLPTVNATESRGRAPDTVLPIIGQRGALLEAQPQPLGGLSEPWKEAGGLPAFERGDALPEDETETATRQATLKTADLISIETALRERYPDRDDQWITDEVDRIRADATSTLPAATTFGP